MLFCRSFGAALSLAFGFVSMVLALGCASQATDPAEGSENGLECPQGQNLCGQVCTATVADNLNCGGCSVTCSAVQQCSAGACTCRSETQACGNACVQTTSDPDNCGACGSVCPGVQVCSVGACSDSCAAELVQCDRSCVDTTTDFANCGACGAACGVGQSCVGGACSCPSGQQLCANACVDVQTSAANCGACGQSCEAGQSCVAGVCSGGTSTECVAPQVNCGGTCVDPQSDEANCGSCGNDCGDLSCVNGTCQTGKACADKTVIVEPTIATFEDYDGTMPVDKWGFAFNAPAGEPAAVYSGLYSYGDGIGTHTLSMATGDGSSHAPRIENPSSGGAGAWGGAVGLWMGCIDASAYSGLTFSVKGPVPSGIVSVSLAMEQTSPPDETDPAAGGTCLSECADAAVEIPVPEGWSEVIVPWSAFTPGTANSATIPVTGDNITGIRFSIQLPYVEDPQNPGEYIPDTGSYDFSFDNVALTSGDDTCENGLALCGTSCVDTLTSNTHCGACDSPCAEGQTCMGGDCTCSGGLSACGEECVDTDTNVYHCGDCNERCLGTCEEGECSSGACGANDTSPFDCSFAWGAADNTGNRASYLDVISTWVGYEYTQGRPGDCDGCALVSELSNTDAIPAFYGYFIGYALPDCNVEPNSPNNLCHAGAQYIRDNRQEILDLYADYAQQAYQTNPNKPVAWLLEGDFVQYTYEEQTNRLTMAELGAFASDIVCAIKGAAPNALVAINHSPWVTNEQANQFWDSMPLGAIDFVWTTGSGTNGGHINAAPEGAGSYNGATANYAWLHEKTTHGIFVDTSFGPSQQADSWSSATAPQLNARISEGVIAANVTEPPGDYQTRVGTLSPQLSSVCQ